LIQIIGEGDAVILNVDFGGTVHYPAVLPTNGTRIGVFQTRLNNTALLPALMLDVWTNNPAQQDIIQVMNVGGAVSYWWDYLGVAHGS